MLALQGSRCESDAAPATVTDDDSRIGRVGPHWENREGRVTRMTRQARRPTGSTLLSSSGVPRSGRPTSLAPIRFGGKRKGVNVSRIFCFPLLLVLISSPLLADDAAARLSSQIIVTASGLAEDVESAPASATVITRKMIEQQAARDVADVLRGVPGLSVSRTGSAGKATSLFTRGASSTHTLVLWNGIEINNPYFAGYDWGRFSTAGVERIEVVRGPFSALYGSDAMAGVVNILTDSGGTSLVADVAGGEKGLFNGMLAGSFGTGAFHGSVSAERRTDDGWSRNDDFSQSSGTANVEWRGPLAFTIGLLGRYTSYEVGIPFNVDASGAMLVPSPARRQSGNESQFAIPVRQSLGRFSCDVTLSQSNRNDDFADADDPFGFTSSSTESITRRAHGAATWRTGAFGTFVAGAEYEQARVDDVSNFGTALDGETRSSRSVFFEDRFSHQFAGGSQLEIAAGVRNDSFDTFGSRLSPRASAAWITGMNKFRAAYGEAFRAPSIGELYFPFSGNPDLDAESSRSSEAGWDRYFVSGSISITAFDSRYTNLIVFDNSSYMFRNVGAATSRGLELGASRHLGGGFSTAVSYTYLQTRSDDDGRQMLRRPKHSGSIDLAWQHGRSRANLLVNHAGSRPDILPVFPYTRIESSAHTTADLTLGFRMRAFEPYVKMENLTDTTYEEVAGFPSAGRRAVVGLRYTVR